MGPGHLALPRIAVRTVTALACARQKHQRPLAHVDPADAVAFGVGETNVAVRPDTKTFGAGKGGGFGWATVARKPLLSGASPVVNCAGFQIELIDRVSLAQGQPKVTSPVEVQRA